MTRYCPACGEPQPGSDFPNPYVLPEPPVGTWVRDGLSLSHDRVRSDE